VNAAVFVDAVGTLLRTAEPVGVAYARAAAALGHPADPDAIERRFRAGFRAAREEGLTQIGDGRPFWRRVVGVALETDDPAVFEALYAHYAQPAAWAVDDEALRVLGELARRGARLAVVSNFDTRLRGLYEGLALDQVFSALVCSGELGVEKPDPWIFWEACRVVGVVPREALHLGDDEEADVRGARRAGLDAVLVRAGEWPAAAPGLAAQRVVLGGGSRSLYSLV
jgi:putative hydrolase of the HAD superfamily